MKTIVLDAYDGGWDSIGKGAPTAGIDKGSDDLTVSFYPDMENDCGAFLFGSDTPVRPMIGDGIIKELAIKLPELRSAIRDIQ